MHVVTFSINTKVKKKRIRAMAPMLAQAIRQTYNNDLSLSIRGDGDKLLIECLIMLKRPLSPEVSDLDSADMQRIVQGLEDIFGSVVVDVHVNPASQEQEIGWALYTRTQHIQQGGMIQ